MDRGEIKNAAEAGRGRKGAGAPASAPNQALDCLLVTQTLAVRGVLSRADLQSATGLSRTRLTAAVTSLLASGALTVPTTRTGAGRGRPTQLLALNRDRAQYVGLAIQTQRSFALIQNINHDQLLHLEVPASPHHTPTQRIEDLLDHTLAAAAAAGIELGTLRGSGCAITGLLPGPEVASGPTHGTQQARIARAATATRLGTPVIVTGTIAAAATAELGLSPRVENCMYVRISDGVGAAQVVTGQVVSGTHHLAGELGHITVDPEGEQCFCGKRGCLETVCSVPALCRQTGATGSLGLAQAWLDGDPQTRHVLTTATDYLGRVIGSVALFTDPGKIIVAWTLVQQIPQLLARLREVITAQMLPDLRNSVEVEAAVLPESTASAMGAALLAARYPRRSELR